MGVWGDDRIMGVILIEGLVHGGVIANCDLGGDAPWEELGHCGHGLEGCMSLLLP